MAEYSLHTRIPLSPKIGNRNDPAGKLNLALLASRFLCHCLEVKIWHNDDKTFWAKEGVPFATREDPRIRGVNAFVLHVLNETRLVDDVVFGALMIVERLHNTHMAQFLGTYDNTRDVLDQVKLLFVPAYIIAGSLMTGVGINVFDETLQGDSIDSEQLWERTKEQIRISATNFEDDPCFTVQGLEKRQDRMMVDLNGDNSLDYKILNMFKTTLIKDFGSARSKAPFPYYPRSLATSRPAFLQKA